MANNHWDLYSILSSNKVSTFTNPTTIFETDSSPSQTLTTITTTNNLVSPQNTTPSYFNDFNLRHENNTIPLFSLKPDDFIDLELLKINFDHNSTISTPTTTMHTPTINTLTTPTTIIPTIITPATTTLIPMPSSHTTINTTTSIPTDISTTTTITNTSVQYSNKNSTFFDYPTINEQQQMQSNEFTELEKMLFKYNSTITTTTATNTTFTLPTTTTNAFTIPTPTTTIPFQTTTISTTIPTITTMTNTITSFCGTNQNVIFSDFPLLINQQQIQQNNKNQVFVPHSCVKITIIPYDGAYNQPLVQQPIEHPQRPKSRSRKRIYKHRETIECHVSEDELSKDLWAWRKYGEKTIKGSPHPRSYYKCSTFKDCPARKLVEKSKTNENIYVVTFEGAHNHKQPKVMRKSQKK